MQDEVQRLGKLLQAFVWGQLALAVVWAITTSVIDPGSTVWRFALVAIVGAASAVTVKLERAGRRTAAAVLLVSSVWLVLAARMLSTGVAGHGAWFLMAVLVGEAGLFIGVKAAIAVTLISGAFGAALLVFVHGGVLIPMKPPGPWLDWSAGVFLFLLVAVLEVSAVRLYRGGLEAARTASLRHRTLFDTAPIALVELDLEYWRTTDVNDLAVRLLGSDRTELLRKGVPGEVRALVVDALANKQRVVDQELALELGGERRQVVVRAELPDDLRSVVVSLADVTEQRRLAEQLHDARRFETVAGLAGSVAHDFNNLLTVAQISADRLARRIGDARELERIRDANTRAATLTRQLLVFSRRDVVHRQVFAPDSVLAKLEPLLRRTLDPRIELVFELGSAPAAIEMDPAQLELVITNLAHNAADAMTEQGTLRVESRTGASGVYIVVSDTGTGMASDTRARAFEPFFTTRPGKRAGLGLSIVDTIVREARGRVALESAATGTRVELEFPVAEPSPTTATVAAGNERILLVEDNDGVRDVARATLEEAGYAVVAVRNGDEALAAVAAGKLVDLVVSDLVMPGIGGRELVDKLRAGRPMLPVLYISGFAADGPPVLDGNSRVGFLSKPFTAEQLLASVRSVFPAEQSGSGT